MLSHAENVQRDVVRRLLSAPETFDKLRSALRDYSYHDIKAALTVLLSEGTIACTTGRFWLRTPVQAATKLKGA